VNVLIIEDELNAVKQLKRLIRECDNSIHIVGHTDSIESSVHWLKTHADKMPDLIFMDIQLADGLSFEIFTQIELQVPVIFCTAYDEYAIRAFQVNSVDYLLKPLDINALRHSLEKYSRLALSYAQPIDINSLLQQISQSTKQHKTRFLVKVIDRFMSIQVEQISYFYIEHKIVNLVSIEGRSHAIDLSLDELEGLLDHAMFFRINRQTIVSINGIRTLENDYGRLNVYMRSSHVNSFTISREKTTLFKNWMDQ